MFEKYTEGARKSIFYARQESISRAAESIAPEHLLLGLLRAEPSLIHRLSPHPSVGANELRRELMAALTLEDESPRSGEVPLSAEAKRVMFAAHEASSTFGHWHIGVEHLLLGLLGEEPGGTRKEAGTFDVGRFLAGRGFNRQMVEEKIRNRAAD